MNMKEARELAAQCWCDPETSGIEMDATLAEAFARRLVNVAPNPIRAARATMAAAFKADPDFRDSYVANIAMLLHDRYGILGREVRNAAGDDIVRLVFES